MNLWRWLVENVLEKDETEFKKRNYPYLFAKNKMRQYNQEETFEEALRISRDKK